jgi:hypothetical protein
MEGVVRVWEAEEGREDIQEALLFLPLTQRGRDPLLLADLQPIAATLDWRKQRRLWRQLLPA